MKPFHEERKPVGDGVKIGVSLSGLAAALRMIKTLAKNRRRKAPPRE